MSPMAVEVAGAKTSNKIFEKTAFDPVQGKMI